MSRDYPVYLYPLPESEGGGFAAFVPDLIGCMSDGATPDEALANVQDAIGEWIREATELGQDIPAPGSASERAQQERQEMVAFIKNQLSKIDGKITDLERRMEAISEAMDQRLPYGWMPIPHAIAGQNRQNKSH